MNTVAAVILGGLAILGVRGLMKDWRAAEGDTRFKQSALWPWSAASWAGFRRTSLVNELVLICLVLGTVLMEWGLWIGFLFFLCLLMELSIFLFNRPRVLVPPALRRQPGWMRGRGGKHGCIGG